ncbi:putative leader peptide [Streptomyces sp. NPDC056948]
MPRQPRSVTPRRLALVARLHVDLCRCASANCRL